MESDREKLVEQLFQKAHDLAPADRERFLTAECGSDADLRAEIDALLRHGDAAPSRFLAGSAEVQADDVTPDPILDGMVGRRIGRYTLLRVIGSGGMGTVYEAEQEQPSRRVAVKLIRHGFTSGTNVRRFLNESDVLGRLNHPGIAQVYEAGVHREADGVMPYFAMEYLPDAVSILEFASAHFLSLHDRLTLFVSVCEAVQYAHQRAVIHRDLKPANVLVSSDGRAKIIDFGVARVMSSEADRSRFTITGQIVGTLRYMSPEQCSSAVIDLDTTTDVYSLGVVLYELLAGSAPYDTAGDSPLDLPRIIRDTDPRPPSTVQPSLRGDLDLIVLKAMARDRRRRYQSVAEFADDLGRYLRGDAIRARRPTRWYLLRKGLARHWIAASVVAGFTVVCGASAAWLSVLYAEARTQRIAAEEALELAEQRRYYNAVSLAHVAIEAGQTKRAAQHLDDCPPSRRGWEWNYLQRLLDQSRASWPAHDRNADCVFAPDGGTVVSFSTDGSIRVWDAGTLELRRELKGHSGPVRSVSCTPDARILVSGGDDRTVRLWDLTNGDARVIAEADADRVTCVTLSGDGTLVASSGLDETVRLWSAADLRLVRELEAGPAPIALAFVPVTGEFVTGSADGDIVFWDRADGRATRRIASGARTLAQLSFSADGAVLAAASWDNMVRVWDVDTLALRHTFDCGADVPLGVAVDPDATTVAVAAGAIHSWDVRTGQPHALRLGHLGGASSVAYAPDGRTLASAGYDGIIRLWDEPPDERPVTLRGHADFVRGVAAFADGQRLASVSRDGVIKLWNLRSRDVFAEIETGVTGDQTLALSRDEALAVTGGLDGVIRVFDLNSYKPVRTIQSNQHAILAVAISPEGREIASAGGDGRCRFWDLETGAPNGEVHPSDVALRHVVYSFDGSMLATSGNDKTCRIWERHALNERLVLAAHDDSVGQAAFSPDGGWIATAANDGAIRIFEVATGRALHVLHGHRSAAQSLVFLPDGSRLISGGYDNVINVWDPNSGSLALTLRGHRGGIPWLTVSPDGHWFASASNDASIRVWRAIGQEHPGGP